MAYLRYLLAAALIALEVNVVSGGPAMRPAAVKPRDDVGACFIALELLRATSFCSSFLHLHDATLTVTTGGGPVNFSFYLHSAA